MLGYSRVPYAAAADGHFFKAFGRLHPTKNFPYVSLLVLGGLAFVFSLLFKMKDVITAIIVMRIIVQFLGQSVGILLYHRKMKQEAFPYRMVLYPLPALIGILVWAFIFFSAQWQFILGAVTVIALGGMVFTLQSYQKNQWPFETHGK
jgi:amino acid transporter